MSPAATFGFTKVAAKQRNVAIVGLEIHVEDRAQNRNASYNRIKQYVPSILATKIFPAPQLRARKTM
ncbi:hypothetical protein X739_31255 [Mesorhizobium sp. LNHC220B00]|nr:hypothetical protein X739_31255 [Mesorhizobium sp. LNHC220B00]